jgi:hypothetical protein
MHRRVDFDKVNPGGRTDGTTSRRSVLAGQYDIWTYVEQLQQQVLNRHSRVFSHHRSGQAFWRYTSDTNQQASEH